MEIVTCPICLEERVVEQPPCPDGHGDCPDWICVECGTVILLAWVEPSAGSRERGAA